MINGLDQAQQLAEKEWQQWPVVIPHYSISFGYCDGWFTRNDVSKLTDDSVIMASITIDDSFNWGDATLDSNVYDLQALLTHEIGHILGATDQPEDYVGAMRYNLELGDITQRTVTAEDIALLAEPGLSFSCSVVGHNNSWSFSVALVVVVVIIGLVRRWK